MAAPLGQALSPELMAASAVFFGVFGMVLAVASLGARKSVQVHARLARHALTVDTGELALAGGFTGLTQPFARHALSMRLRLIRNSLGRSWIGCVVSMSAANALVSVC